MGDLFQARSDDLMWLRGVLSDLGQVGRALKTALGTVLQVRVVVDTQIVLADLKWLVSGRKSQAARTALQEAIAAGTVIPYAPDQLDEEVREKIPVLASQTRRAVVEYERAWDAYSKQLRFVPVRAVDPASESSRRNLRDPTDLAFLLAAEAIGAAAIISRDGDIRAAGIAVLDTVECLLDLRDYSRSKAVELQITLVGIGTFGVGVGGLALLAKGAFALGGAFMRAPTWLKTLIVAGMLLPLLHTPTRERAKALLRSALNAAKDAAKLLDPVLREAFATLDDVSPKARLAHERLSQRLTEASTKSVRALAFRACVDAGTPLSTSEIASRVIASGYQTRNARFEEYVRRVLRRDARLHPCGEDDWVLNRVGEPAGSSDAGGIR